MTDPIQAEATATPEPASADKPDDGSVVVRLVTDLGEADIRVPPRGKWRSTARNRMAANDDMGWAVLTLSREDAEKWIDLDPTVDEALAFFTLFDQQSPLLNRADRRAQRHLRSA